MAHTVASTTDLPFVLGLSERDPDAVVAQARRLLDAVPRPPVALMAQIGDADPAVAAASLRRLYDATGVGILVQDYPVVSGVTRFRRAGRGDRVGVPVRGRREIGVAADVRRGRAPGAPARRAGFRRPRRRRPARRAGRGVGRRDDRIQPSGGAGRRAARPPRRRLRGRPRRLGAVAAARQLRGTAAGRPGDSQRGAAATRRDRLAAGCDGPRRRCRPRWSRCWTSISRTLPVTSATR